MKPYEHKLTEDQYRELARQTWERDGEIEVDSNAVVSLSEDGGAYVQAWVWVYGPAQEDEEETA